ncbi:MAG TPA: tripartite tricarboxylate transporter substrate binding protein [Burkholderiales bacterium]|nr:tripartite tricarboxylate transporter substrate binding protein [Burkholderiales bacterium]
MIDLLRIGPAAILLAAGSPALSQAPYPSKPVRIVVPAAPGGGTDILARVLAQKFSESLGKQFLVENRPGAGQIVGTESVARASPDGYTLLMAASPIATNQVLYPKIPYDTLRDFAPIAKCATVPNMLVVHPSVPAKSLKELIALARSRPGELTYASAGIGTSPHLSMELFRSMARVKLIHVAYKGTGIAIVDVLAGQVQLMSMNLLTGATHVKSGRLRALGVTSAQRAAMFPAVPTIAEAGVPGYEAISWYGLLAPAGTPRAVIDRVHAEAAKALQSSEVKERLTADGAEPSVSRPEEFAAFIRSEVVKWAKVVKDSGITAE